MKYSIVSVLLCAVMASCTYRDHTQKEEKTYTQEDARDYVQQLAGMQYLDYADVIGDTVYVGVPSRRGLEHSQDNMARTFLADMERGNFSRFCCCRVINTAKDFVWTDSIISGQILGEAVKEVVEK